MIIREATEQDIPKIVQVLKASLGEQDLPLSEKIWNYKHVNNPFGKSMILLAEENDQITGVRAFMRWKWQIGGQVFSAFRAVDTATHPEHQGKGVFKKLTLKAIELAKKERGNFIFNTPNEKSRPGYLKMGWEQVGKINVRFLFVNPLHSIFTQKNKSYSIIKSCSQETIQENCVNYNFGLEKKGKNFTPKSADYLQWRYEENPLQSYEVFANEQIYLAGYSKKRGKLREFRIVESIISPEINSLRPISNQIKKWSRKHGAHFVSSAPLSGKMDFLGFSGNFGPILTLKELNLYETNKNHLQEMGNWNYSLGDLELF